jgi:capsular polysaccharide biosynthesis protein
VTESIDIWSQARIIIGIHGGSIANLIWAPADRQTAVIEICPTGNPSVSWWDLAAGMRVSYWQVLVRDTTHDTPMTVPIEHLEETLEEVQRRIK